MGFIRAIAHPLALWLVLPLLVPHDDVLALLVVYHAVGPQRLGAALDSALSSITSSTALLPSQLRVRLVRAALDLRATDASPFTLRAADLYNLLDASDPSHADRLCSSSPTRRRKFESATNCRKSKHAEPDLELGDAPPAELVVLGPFLER